jgi:hypothetical protein
MVSPSNASLSKQKVMPQMKKYLLATVAALALGGPAIADPTLQEIDEMRAMHPIAPEATHLPSHSTIGHLRPGFEVLLGHDAIRFREIIDAVASPDTEAEAANFDAKSELIYAWINPHCAAHADRRICRPRRDAMALCGAGARDGRRDDGNACGKAAAAH